MINGGGGERGNGGRGFEPISYLPPPTTGTGMGYESSLHSVFTLIYCCYDLDNLIGCKCL